MEAFRYLKKHGFSSFAFVYGPTLAALGMVAFLLGVAGLSALLLAVL